MTMKRSSHSISTAWCSASAKPLAIACAFALSMLASCAGSNTPAAESTERELRMTPERVFDAERPFMRGNPVGIELHWWLARDQDGDIARALAPHDRATDFLPESTRERLRLSGIRAVAVPLSEVFILHQIAPPRAGWSRRWLGQESEWVQLVRSRSVTAGTRASVYGSEQRLSAGVLRLLGRGWMQPQAVLTADGRRIEPVMNLQLVAQVQQRDPQTQRQNRFEIPDPTARPRLQDQGPFIDDIELSLSVPRGYAIVLTTDWPENDWANIDGVTRENLIAELERREAEGEAEDDEDRPAADAPRFGPSPAAPIEADPDLADESAQVFDTLDAPMPSLSESFGPRAAPIPTVGQLLLETRDSLSRPMRGVIILIPRLPEEFQLLP